MRTRGIKRGLGLLIALIVVWSAIPILGQIPIHDEAMELTSANAEILAVEALCVAIIKNLKSADAMESMGGICEDRVFHINRLGWIAGPPNLPLDVSHLVINGMCDKGKPKAIWRRKATGPMWIAGLPYPPYF